MKLPYVGQNQNSGLHAKEFRVIFFKLKLLGKKHGGSYSLFWAKKDAHSMLSTTSKFDYKWRSFSSREKAFYIPPNSYNKNLKMVSKSRVTSVAMFQKRLFEECSFASDGNLKRNLLTILRHVFN